MATKRDYYEILGISRDASDSDVKKAYRKLAKEHHPDMAAKSDKDHAEAKFKEINEAYQVLSDPEKKKMYDQFGHAGSQYTSGQTHGNAGFGGFGGFGNGAGGQWGPFTYSYTSSGPGQQGFEDIDPFDIFAEVFGARGFGGRNRRPAKGKNLFYELHIAFADAVKGVEKEVNIESGKTTIKIPAGVRDGTEIKFAEKGMPAEGLPNGDLFITVRVPLPKEFRERAGDNLATIKKIDFVTAILGGSIKVPVVDITSKTGLSETGLKIPSGTQSGTNFRLRGKGLPKLHGNGQGDVIVRVDIDIPQRLSGKQRKILEDYRKTL